MKIFISYIFLLPVFALWIFIVWANYTPGTYLSGWDNLHPEFNFGLNIGRSLSAFWQEYQGLGLLGGMGHAADLPRQLILLGLSFFLNNSLLRYAWTFGMLFTGAAGVFFVVKKFVGGGLAGLAASLYYLLNLATVQVFYVPFETFVGFYGFMPWLIYFALSYLRHPIRKKLTVFALMSFVATGAFYVQTMFVVYVAILAMFVLEYLIKHGKKGIKPVVRLLSVLFVVNSFWLISVVSFSLTKASVVGDSKINSIATPDTFYMNQAAGTLENIAMLKGFWFDYLDADKGIGEFNYLMSEWRTQLEMPWVKEIWIGMFVTSLIGIVLSLFVNVKDKKNFGVAPLILFLTCVAMLTAGNGTLGVLYRVLSENIAFFGELFRSAFTKWSLAAAFIYAWGIGSFVHLAGRISKYLAGVVVLVIGSLLIYTSAPVFKSQLISPTMRVNIPQEYFDLFKFSKSLPKQSRIANLPMNNFWGWGFYDWGYRGSGFLWYGIEQPILDRAFDVWSQENEQFYWETSKAIKSGEVDLVKNAFEKYDVSYGLIDRSVTLPEAEEQTKENIDNTEEILNKIGAREIWKKGFLSLYELSDHSDKFVELKGNGSGSNDYIFSGISKERVDVGYKRGIDGSEYVRVSSEDLTKVKSRLIIPGLGQKENYFASARVEYKENLISLAFREPFNLVINDEVQGDLGYFDTFYIELSQKYQKILLNIGGENIEINNGGQANVSDIKISYGKDLEMRVYDASGIVQSTELSTSFNEASVNECWKREGGNPLVRSNRPRSGEISFETSDAVGCIALKIGTFSVDMLAQVDLPFYSVDNARPDFCVLVEGGSECLNEEIFYHSDTSDKWTDLSRKVEFKAGTSYWLIINARPPDKAGETWSIVYGVPKVNLIPLVNVVSFSSGIVNNIYQEKTVEVPEQSKVSLDVIANRNVVDFGLSKNWRNCDLFERGSATKIPSKAFYEANDFAANCDFKLLGGMFVNDEYLLRLIGKNETGRAPKFYLYNPAGWGNQIEAILDKGEFDNTFVVDGYYEDGEQEYNLNIETKSWGIGQKSVNEIQQVSYYKFPVSWLSSINVVPIGRGVGQIVKSDIESINKIGTWFYNLRISNIESKPNLYLAQAYDPGWVAIGWNGVVPSKLDHFESESGWANEWEINTSGDRITIFYWPQILQWGIVVLGVLFLRKVC